MALEWIRAQCLAMSHVTEHVQWGNDLVFKVAGKMFAIIVLEPAEACMSFKVSAEEFAELIERSGVIPAPYMARAQWIALESPDALPRPELTRLIANSYRLVFEKLPKKVQAELALAAKNPPAKKSMKKRTAKTSPAKKKVAAKKLGKKKLRRADAV